MRLLVPVRFATYPLDQTLDIGAPSRDIGRETGDEETLAGNPVPANQLQGAVLLNDIPFDVARAAREELVLELAANG